MNTIVLDECGFTGEDLTNKDQPVFVVFMGLGLHLFD
jgi:hypothetical protein